jgi:hypothetical protein
MTAIIAYTVVWFALHLKNGASINRFQIALWVSIFAAITVFAILSFGGMANDIGLTIKADNDGHAVTAIGVLIGIATAWFLVSFSGNYTNNSRSLKSVSSLAAILALLIVVMSVVEAPEQRLVVVVDRIPGSVVYPPEEVEHLIANERGTSESNSPPPVFYQPIISPKFKSSVTVTELV